MKNILKRKKKNLLKNEKGQGMVEYILLLVVVIGIIMAFKPRIMKAFNDAMGKTESGVGDIIQ
jgi:Flp pilus assembly pilin Flp